MTDGQLNVSAIRQHFEFIGYRHPSHISKLAHSRKPRGSDVLPVKDPPKTLPKPKAVSVQSYSKCASDESDKSDASAVTGRQSPQYDDVFATTDSSESAQQCVAGNIVGFATDDDHASHKTAQSQQASVTVAVEASEQSGTRSTPARSYISREDSDIDMYNSSAVKETCVSKWSSTSCIMSAVRRSDALDSARQKTLLSRIAELQLQAAATTTRRRPVDVYSETADDESVVQRSRQYAGVTATTQSTVAASDCTNSQSAAAVHVCSGQQLTSAAPQRRRLVHTTRPVSLYPVDSSFQQTADDDDDDNNPMSDSPTSLSVNSCKYNAESEPAAARQLSSNVEAPVECILDTQRPADVIQCSSEQPLAATTSPATISIVSSRPAGQQTSAARSRHSYIALTQFVGDKFAFLDHLLQDTADSTQSSVLNESLDQLSQQHAQYDDSWQQTATSKPRSMIRKSVVLPNGEIVELIGDAFTFLSEYEDELDMEPQ